MYSSEQGYVGYKGRYIEKLGEPKLPIVILAAVSNTEADIPWSIKFWGPIPIVANKFVVLKAWVVNNVLLASYT